MASVPDWMKNMMGQTQGVTYQRPTGIPGGAQRVGRQGRTWNPAFAGARAPGSTTPMWQPNMNVPSPPTMGAGAGNQPPTIPPPVTPPSVPPVPPVIPPAVPPPTGGPPQYPAAGGWSPLLGSVAAANIPGPTSGASQPFAGGTFSGNFYLDPSGNYWSIDPMTGAWVNLGAQGSGWNGVTA